jgi:uncharacterized protein YbjT (DUF2867 family)
MSSVLIAGGNGYVGSAACRYAVAKGIKVFAVSRSGLPPSSEPWTDKVTYVKGDVMTPATYADALKESKGVIHSIGVLIDTKFKFKD